MAQFVFVASEVSSAQFEKALEIKNKAGGRITWVSQGGNSHGVISSGMVNTTVQHVQGRPPVEVVNNVRFEWTDNGVEAAIEIMKIFVPQNPQAPAPAQ